MLDRFAAVIDISVPLLSAIPDPAHRDAPGSWSRREELGHLIDSAINNYARVIRAQREAAPALPSYEQNVWVERGGYHDREWPELIAIWSAVNRHMLAASRRAPAAALDRQCTIGGGELLTLGFVIEDYVDHMVHHLQHIGIDVARFRRAESAYA